MSNLPQQTTINQYVADGITTVYNYSFLILSATSEANDISVYVTPSGQPANPLADIQTLNTAYTVQNVGNVSGGTISFLSGHTPPNGAIVTIVRTMSVSIDTEFAQAQNFNGANLDDAFERVVLIMQQLNTYYMNNALSYVINSYLPTLGLNFLPVLTNIDNQVWISQGGRIIAAQLINDNMSTLRSQLASQVPNGDGASLIGFYDEVNNHGTTLDVFLNTYPRPNNGNLVIGGFMTTNPFQRGTSFSAPASGQYVADRFAYLTAGSPTGTIATQQVNDSPTVTQSGMFGTKALQVSCLSSQSVIAASDLAIINYNIEGYDFCFIAQREFTLSFWVKTNLPGTYHIAFSNAAGDRTYVAPFAVSGSGIWQKITITVPASPSGGTWDYTNGTGLSFAFILAAGSNWQGTPNTWNSAQYFSTASQINFLSSNTNEILFDRFCVEPGILSTPWVARPFEEELAMCQRYYQKTYELGTPPGTVTNLGAISFNTVGTTVNTDYISTDRYVERMRADPTVHYYSTNSGTIDKMFNFTSSADITVNPSGASQLTVFSINNSGGTIAANSALLYHMTLDAEL